jgi:hypothetical protein
MKAPIAQSGALPGNAQDCAIGKCIGFHGQKSILNNSDLGWGLIQRYRARWLHLNPAEIRVF